MDKRLALALPVLVALALAFVPIGQAYTSGVVYLPPSVSFKTTYEKTIVDQMQFSVNANSTKSIDLRNYTLPGIIHAVIVKIDGASGNVKLTAKDENGTAVASADVVPLASGYTVTLPGSTRVIDIQNSLNAIWNGTITIIVQATNKVELEFEETQIVITSGVGIANAEIVVYRLAEAGSLGLSVYDVRPRASFDVMFVDPSDVDGDGKTSNDEFIYVKAHNDASNPARYPVQVKIIPPSRPGTYSVTLNMHYLAGVQMDVDPWPPGAQPETLGTISLSVALQDTGSGTVTVQPDEDDNTIAGIPVKWALAVLFLLVIVAILMSMGRK